MDDLVTLTDYESHLLLTLDDGKANALSFDMLDAINAGLDRADGRTVVLAGRPGKFSAGFDLKVMAGGGEPMMRLLRSGADLAVRLLSFDTPVVFAVSGHAMAMGALLCLSADYRVGARGPFKLGLNEVAIGMTLPWFGIELARARLAPRLLSDAVGLARIYDPEAAIEAGYLDEVVDDAQLMPRVTEVAESCATLNMAAHRGTKARFREELFARLEKALQRDFEDSAALASATGT